MGYKRGAVISRTMPKSRPALPWRNGLRLKIDHEIGRMERFWFAHRALCPQRDAAAGV